MTTRAHTTTKLAAGRGALALTRNPQHAECSDRSRPDRTNLNGSGRYVAKDPSESGDVALLMRAQLGHGVDHVALTGRGPVAGRAQQERNADQCVVHPADKPRSAISGVVGFLGNRAPTGAPDRVAGMADLKFAERPRFDGEEARFRAVKNKKYREGKVLVIRSERPQHGPVREAFARRETVALHRQGQPGDLRDSGDTQTHTASDAARRAAGADHA